MSMPTITFLFDVGPNLQTLGGKLVALFDDLNSKLDDLKAAATAEHEEVLKAIQDLQAQVTSGLSADQVTQVDAKFADTLSAIQGIYQPQPTPVPVPPPAPEPTPAPV